MLPLIGAFWFRTLPFRSVLVSHCHVNRQIVVSVSCHRLKIRLTGAFIVTVKASLWNVLAASWRHLGGAPFTNWNRTRSEFIITTPRSALFTALNGFLLHALWLAYVMITSCYFVLRLKFFTSFADVCDLENSGEPTRCSRWTAYCSSLLNRLNRIRVKLIFIVCAISSTLRLSFLRITQWVFEIMLFPLLRY